MNNVSFGSTYKVYLVSSDLNKDNKGHSILSDYCKKNAISQETQIQRKPILAPQLGKNEKIFVTTTISSPRTNDHAIDMICKNYDLKHVKINPKDNSIISSYTPQKTSMLQRLLSTIRGKK